MNYEIKKKKCKICESEFMPFRTFDKFCSAKCASEGKRAKLTKKVAIKPISEKRAQNLKRYRVLRDDYLKQNPICEVHDCNKATTNLHHKNGRTGNRLTDVNFFMACCSSCHPKRIHENPEWAREHGYLI